jgi:hypothetical protein
LRALHALLSGGTSEAAKLRGWYRLLLWLECTTPRAKLRAVCGLVKLPARAAREALRGVRDHGTAASERYGVSARRQLFDIWWLGVRHGFEADMYYRYQMFRPERRRDAGSYIRSEESMRLYNLLIQRVSREDAEPFADKRRFRAWCAGRGFPVVPSVMEFDRGGVTSSGANSGLPKRDLFSKPADLNGGRGAVRWRYVGSDRYAGDDGRVLAESELIAELTAASRYGPILLQPCLRNHATLVSLTSGGLCTARLVTMRSPGGTVELLLAVYRMPVGGAAADNFDRGGLAATVDPETGRLGPAVCKDTKHLVHSPEHHPDTGARIQGHQLPFWGDAKRLVIRAHEAAGRMVFIGWDVALLEVGPVLVEANRVPCSKLAQMPSGVPLGTTDFAACVNAHLRESFAL